MTKGAQERRALAVFDLADGVADRRAAWVTWVAVCLSLPFIPHAWLLFPEMPGALIVAWGALWLWRPVEARAMTWIWRGAVMGLLPWLDTKFVVFLAIFAAGLLVRLRHQHRMAISFILPIAMSVGVWLLSFAVIYGTIDPQAAYGAYARTFVINENIPRGVLGLLFDQKFGLACSGRMAPSRPPCSSFLAKLLERRSRCIWARWTVRSRS